jgi:hypothetical protein
MAAAQPRKMARRGGGGGGGATAAELVREARIAADAAMAAAAAAAATEGAERQYSAPTTPAPPDAPEREGSCVPIGGGTYATVYACDHTTAKRTAIVKYEKLYLWKVVDMTQRLLMNTHMLASDYTRPLALTGSRDGGITRALHIGSELTVLDTKPVREKGGKIRFVGTPDYEVLRAEFRMELTAMDLYSAIEAFTKGSGVRGIWKFREPALRMRLAYDLLKTLADMHAMRIRHRDIKETNILVRLWEQVGDRWQIAFTDFDTADVRPWRDAQALHPMGHCGTPGYHLPFGLVKERAKLARDAAAAGNPYMHETAAAHDDAWALCIVLWRLLLFSHMTYVKWDEVRRVNVQMMRGKDDKDVGWYRKTLEARLAAPTHGLPFTEEQGDRVRALFEVMFKWWENPGDETLFFTAADLLDAFVPAEKRGSAVWRPCVLTWDRPATNPLAHVRPVDAWRAAATDVLTFGGGDFMQTRLYMAMTAALGAKPEDEHRRVWAFMTLASALFHAQTLLAYYFVRNPTATWPPAPDSDDKDVLLYALFAGIMLNLPDNHDVLRAHASEPVSLVALVVLSKIGILPPLPADWLTNDIAVDAWHEVAKESDLTVTDYGIWKATGNTGKTWSPVMVRLLNKAGAWFGYNVSAPGTLALVTDAFAVGWSEKTSLPLPREQDHYEKVPPYYEPDDLRMLRHLLSPAGVGDVLRVHAVANAVDPSLPERDVHPRSGGKIASYERTLAQRVYAELQGASYRAGFTASPAAAALAPEPAVQAAERALGALKFRMP